MCFIHRMAKECTKTEFSRFTRAARRMRKYQRSIFLRLKPVAGSKLRLASLLVAGVCLWGAGTLLAAEAGQAPPPLESLIGDLRSDSMPIRVAAADALGRMGSNAVAAIGPMLAATTNAETWAAAWWAWRPTRAGFSGATTGR